MTCKTLTFEAFRQLLDICGGRLAAWPAEQREQAEALLAVSAEARAALGAAQEQDLLLRDSLAKAPAGLVDRILSASGAVSQRDGKMKRSAR
jgi:hypothetical protein